MVTKNIQQSGKQKKIEYLLTFFIVLFALLIVNVLAQDYFFRVDLTEDKRFTITPATKELLTELDDVVYVDVYLDGDVPAGFKRLQRSIREILEEFKAYAGANLQFNFIDPSKATSQSGRNEFYRNLAEKGIQPTNIFDTEDGKKVEKLVFPGAVVSYGGREEGVMLLKGNQAASAQEKLNQSVEGLEYELATAIRELTQERKKRIGWIMGHQGLDSIQVASLNQALKDRYSMEKVRIEDANSLSGFDAIILAKPQQAFSDQEKFYLDQYFMNNGKGLFFMEMVHVNMDSAGGEGTVAVPITHNLEDMLFKYGLRVNQNLIQDLNSGAYPVVVGYMGDQPQVRMMRWPFFPILNNYGKSLIVRNLDATYSKFASSIDTVKADGVKKIPLIFTSQYTRTFTAPVTVSINDLRKELNPALYDQGPIPVAYLLEGNFTSLYKNRILPKGISTKNIKENANQAKLVVVADGDFPANEVNMRTGEPYPLGFAPFTQQTFANQEFILNVLAYMVNEEGIITARSKQVQIRPLDTIQVQEEKTLWQVINLGVPIALVIALGIVRYYWRKKKYTKFSA